MTTQATQLLERFIAILDLRDVEQVDTDTIMALHAAHPEQLAIKLSYLALQCQIVVMDSKMTRDDRLKAVRRVFLDYALMPPNSDIESLADYVNEIAAMDHDTALEPSIRTIEAALQKAPRRQWQERWFPVDDASPDDPGLWSVIVSSPRYEDEGWAALRRHQERWPDVYFELDGPFDLESPFYAVVAGRGLPLESADELLGAVKGRGMAEDAFRWRAPPTSDQARPSKREPASGDAPISPTPPRPTFNDVESSSLSQ